MTTPQTSPTHQYGNLPVHFQVHRYRSTNRPCLRLVHAQDGTPVATATVNLPDEALAPSEVAVKDHSENEGMLEWLWKAGIIERQPTRYVPSGFVRIPICTLTPAGRLLVGKEPRS